MFPGNPTINTHPMPRAPLGWPRHRLVRRIAVAGALLGLVGCTPTEPPAATLDVRASIGTPSSVDIFVAIPVRIENVGAVTAYVPQCHVVQRREGGRWVDDVHLSGACSSVPPDSVPAGAEISRVVDFLRTRMPAGESTVLRVVFRVADDASYEPSRVVSVRTGHVTVR